MTILNLPWYSYMGVVAGIIGGLIGGYFHKTYNRDRKK